MSKISVDRLEKPQNQQAILFIEVGAWLHLLGKFSDQFIYDQLDNKGKQYKDFYKAPGNFLKDLFEANWPQTLFPKLSGFQWPQSFSQFSTKHDEPKFGKGQFVISLVADAHGRGSGTEKGLFDDHTCNPAEAKFAHLDTVFGYSSSCLDLTQLAKARDALYKFLEEQLNHLKDDLTNKKPIDNRPNYYRNLVKRLRQDFSITVGDTRRPINDVSLFDQTFATVAFLKAALAENLLQGQWRNPLEQKNKYRWRLLRVGINGLDFLERAQGASDIIARHKVLNEALDEVCDYLEVSLPLTIEAYRDENGSVYLLPEYPDDLLDLQTSKGKSLRQTLEEIVSEKLFYEVFPDISCSDRSSRTLYAFGQLINSTQPTSVTEPTIMDTWWKEVQTGIKVGNKIESNLEACSVCGVHPIVYGVEQVYKEPNQVEYHRKAAYQRKVCGFCLCRRENRSQRWIEEGQSSTIWTDEVADKNGRLALIAGQFDLDHWLTGELISSLTVVNPADIKDSHSYKDVLSELQDKDETTILSSLNILYSLLNSHSKKALIDIKELRDFIVVDADLDKFQAKVQPHELLTLALMRKTPSFARLRRVWETTRRFWQEVLPTEMTKIPTSLVAKQREMEMTRPRLAIQGILAPAPGNSESPGAFHTYDLVLGQSHLSVVWDSDHRRFITCDNLGYLAGQGQLGREAKTWLMENLGQSLRLEEPAGYGSRSQTWGSLKLEQMVELPDRYTPAIPILAEPRTFMALVPADKAVSIVEAIRQKYEREMGKVRNRLPLHLGVIYFHRRTPLRGALDAGRRMLNRKAVGVDDKWRVAQKPEISTGCLPSDAAHLAEGTQQFKKWYTVRLEQGERKLAWHVPAVMGDGATEDNWYPYIFLETNNDDRKVEDRNRAFKGLHPTGNGTVACWLTHVGDLKEGDEVHFTPATFDFEWLDTTGRRFEIAYQEDGRRRGRQTRPYLLDELCDLNEAWQIICQELTTSQIYALREVIEGKREAWYLSPAASFQDEAFRHFCGNVIANAQWRTRPDKDKLGKLAAWAASGLLADAIELHMEIMKEKPKHSPAKKEIVNE